MPFRRLTHTLLPALALSFAAALPAAYFVSGRREASGENYGRVALGFEANRGQTENSVDFIARGAGYALFLKSSEAVFVLKNQKAASQPKVLRMKLVGSDASATAVGADELEGKTNYLVGDDPSQWRTGVPTYGRVRYAGVYEGVDLVYYGNQRQLEYDFRVAPGADPRALGLKFEGADKVELDANGDLLLKLGEEVVRQPKPFAYQETAGARREVEAAYAVGADGLVRFAVGGYDPARALVIDPVLVYSTFLGGSEGDNAIAVAVDSAGNAYVAGATGSVNFPTVGPVQPAKAGNVDAFVTKLNAAGTAVVYSTYIGGGDEDRALGVAVDSAGSAYVTGLTISDNFPTAAPFKASKTGGASDAFVLKLNPAGSGFVYSTYLGGSNSDTGRGIAVDAAGSAYVTGYIASTDFPTANAVQPTKVGVGDDAFVTKLNPAGSALVYSTYLGGRADDGGGGIAIDTAGSAYVTGLTSSTNFPLLGAIQATNKGAADAFVTKLNPAGTALVYSTYLGGVNQDEGLDIAVDSSGNAHITGTTFSPDYPTANAFRQRAGGWEA
ncbi:MAG TPA: SBBP repeat-containing protein, partial [Pyrinomonadaceae bacterium]